MPTRSLIGVFEDDGRTFRARYCHSDGYPSYQLAALGQAAHGHHDGDLNRLGTALLEYDWYVIAATEATAELQAGAPRSADIPSDVYAVSGTGYRINEYSDTEPSVGTVDEETDGLIEWLYLIIDGHVCAYYAGNGRWQLFGRFSVAELKNLDADDLGARQAAVRD